MSDTALLLVAHGSRRAASNEEVARLAERVAQAAHGRYCAVRHGFIELAEPTLLQAAEACVAAGAASMIALPYFLAAGRHVVQDIPEQLAAIGQRFPQLVVHTAPYLGAADGVPALLLALADNRPGAMGRA